MMVPRRALRAMNPNAASSEPASRREIASRLDRLEGADDALEGLAARGGGQCPRGLAAPNQSSPTGSPLAKATRDNAAAMSAA